MATYRDPIRCFAPLEVLERLLEIRAEAGFTPAVFSFHPMILQTTSTRLALTSTHLLKQKASFTLETTARRWRRAATTLTIH